MKILVLSLHYAPEPIGVGVYSSGMAETLAARGHEVKVVAAKPFYPQWKVPAEHAARGYSTTIERGVEVVRCPHYVPSTPTGLKRILHHMSFGTSAFFALMQKALFWRPDIVIAVAPCLISVPAAPIAAFFGGARTWLHIQDFEMEAAYATGLVSAHGLPARAAAWFERSVLKRFDKVSSISPNMCRKLAEKGVVPDSIVEFRNWAEIETITPQAEPSPYRVEWGIETPHVALYSGNIANKQGIDIVLEAARLLKHRRDLTFVVCGQGPNRASLEAASADLETIRFYDLQPKERLNDLLGLASVHLLPQRADVADLVLPSKLTNMLASGRPVVATAADGTGLADEVEGCGLTTSPGDAAAFAGAITALLDDDALRAHAGAAARRRAEERWAREKILSRLEAELVALAMGAMSEGMTRPYNE